MLPKTDEAKRSKTPSHTPVVNSQPANRARQERSAAKEFQVWSASDSLQKRTATNRKAAQTGIEVLPARARRGAAMKDKGSHGGAEKGQMMRQLGELGNFVRRLRLHARFGELSRAPLRLLRLQLCGETAECDWIARPPDKWDSDLAPNIGARNASLQALKDAIAIRSLLFSTLPDLYCAALRVYRRTSPEALELVTTGTVKRDERAPAAVRSTAMRAKLLGLRFWMDQGILENLQPEEYAVNS